MFNQKTPWSTALYPFLFAALLQVVALKSHVPYSQWRVLLSSQPWLQMVDVCIVYHWSLLYCSCVECSPKVKMYFISLLGICCMSVYHVLSCKEDIPFSNLCVTERTHILLKNIFAVGNIQQSP